jgi:hypothetical protein
MLSTAKWAFSLITTTTATTTTAAAAAATRTHHPPPRIFSRGADNFLIGGVGNEENLLTNF